MDRQLMPVAASFDVIIAWDTIVTHSSDLNRNAVAGAGPDSTVPEAKTAKIDNIEEAIRKVISEDRFDPVSGEGGVRTAPDPDAPRKYRIRFRNGNPERTRVEFPPSPLLAFLQDRISRYRPRWSHNLAILMLAALVYSVWGTVFSLALTACILLSVYLLVGPDRISKLAQSWFARFEKKSPEKAEDLLIRSKRISDRLESFSKRLPESWTQGLYFPSFEREEDLPEKMAEDPFERLKAQLHESVSP